MSSKARMTGTSIDLASDDGVWLRLEAAGFPAALHPAEPDLFCRQAAMPGHDQARLSEAHVAVIGCGGLGSWIALSLARLGVGHLTLIDPDRFDRTNAPRQLMFPDDFGKPKSHALARNILSHMTQGGIITAGSTYIEDVLVTSNSSVDAVDALVVGVDNNKARLTAAAWALRHRIPAVFVMLSRDGLRSQVFLQRPGGPCLSCVLPDLDPERAAPCAAASIASCYLAAAHAVHMCTSSVMGVMVPEWRETSLDGTTERVARPSRRRTCPCTFSQVGQATQGSGIVPSRYRVPLS